MSRRERERTILRIVRERTIRTQAELVDALAERGIRVAQATVSRDVRRLGLARVPAPDGPARYAVPEALAEATARGGEGSLEEVLREFVTALEAARGILVVRTPSGFANAVAVAIDEAGPAGVVGTVAGDDTIFVLTRTDADLERLVEEWRRAAGIPPAAKSGPRGSAP